LAENINCARPCIEKQFGDFNKTVTGFPPGWVKRLAVSAIIQLNSEIPTSPQTVVTGVTGIYSLCDHCKPVMPRLESEAWQKSCTAKFLPFIELAVFDCWDFHLGH